jgi:hypothetical protein
LRNLAQTSTRTHAHAHTHTHNHTYTYILSLHAQIRHYHSKKTIEKDTCHISRNLIKQTFFFFFFFFFFPLFFFFFWCACMDTVLPDLTSLHLAALSGDARELRRALASAQAPADALAVCGAGPGRPALVVGEGVAALHLAAGRGEPGGVGALLAGGARAGIARFVRLRGIVV